MIIIYNLSGLIVAGAGIVAGILVLMVTGWLSAGLLTVSLVWSVAGCWWREQERAPGVKRPYPALFFIPLPFLSIPVAGLAVLSLMVELSGRGQPADRQAEPLRAGVVAKDVPRSGASRVPGAPPDKVQRRRDDPVAEKPTEDQTALRDEKDKAEAEQTPEEKAAARAKRIADAKAERDRQAADREKEKAERDKRNEERVAEQKKQSEEQKKQNEERLEELKKKTEELKKQNEERTAELKKQTDEQLANSMLQAAESHRSVGDTKLYRKTLKELVQKYPKTEAGKKAARRLK